MEPIKPFIEPDFFTPEEYASIQETVKALMDKGIAEKQDKWAYFKKNTNNGFNVIFFSEVRHIPDFPKLSKEVEDKMRNRFNEVTGSTVDHVGVLWARYTKESGEIPSLMPHCDRSETHTGYMVTVELESTLDWDYYVEDEKFEMKKNQAIWFSGTHQAHWRPDKEFGDDDYYDILLFQTHSGNDQEALDMDHFDERDMYCMDVANKYRHLLEETINKTMRMNGRCQ